MDNNFKVPKFEPGGKIKARDLEGLRDSSRAQPIYRNFSGLSRQTPAGQTIRSHKIPSPGGDSSIYTFKITTVNSPLDYTGDLIKSEADETVITNGTGKTLLIQGGTGEALEEDFILLVRRVETDTEGIYRPINLIRLY